MRVPATAPGPARRSPRPDWVGHGPLSRLPRLLWAFVVILAVLAFGVVASRPAAPPDDRRLSPDVALAAKAIDDLLHPTDPRRDALADLPPDFTTVSHVVPGHMLAPDGTVRSVHTDGGCSTPWGDDNTKWDYGVSCKAHDLGYDLLRYAAAKGEPLAPKIRRDLDDRLSYDMHHMCDLNPQDSAATCRVVASIYSAGLVVNSWHQRWGPPRGDPFGSWALGLLVVGLLLAVRVPGLAQPRFRRKRATAELTAHHHDATTGSGMSVLRVASLGAIVLGESVLALAHWGPGQPSWIWPLTWLFQLAPLFFFAGGHANLLAWRATRTQGGGFGAYLAGRVCWLIRPVLAFVTAWLLVPLALELLDVPPAAVNAVGRLVIQPLWLLGLYLIAVALTPLLDAVHRRVPLTLTGAVVALAVVIGALGRTAVAGEVSGVVLALLFQQLAMLHADGRLRSLPRWAGVGAAVLALGGLIVLTTVGGHPRMLIAEPTETAVLAPSIAGVLLLGVVQLGLVLAYRGGAPTLGPRLTRILGAVRTAPMTAYLLYLCTVLVAAGVLGAMRVSGGPAVAAAWLARPQTWFAVLLVLAPTILVFLWFERHRPLTMPVPRTGSLTDGIAASLGVGYGALGVLGFAVTSLTGVDQTPGLFGLPLDPMTNLIHLLLGWYLVHTVRIGTSSRPGPWLLTAVACWPPMIATSGIAVTAVHGTTMAVALVCALVTLVQAARQPLAWGAEAAG